MTVTAAELSEAIVVWTGWGQVSWPHCEEQRVIARFGAERAQALLPAVRRMYDDFYESDASWTVADLVEIGAVAAARFRRRHPDLTEQAVQALTWCYTFDVR